MDVMNGEALICAHSSFDAKGEVRNEKEQNLSNNTK